MIKFGVSWICIGGDIYRHRIYEDDEFHSYFHYDMKNNSYMKCYSLWNLPPDERQISEREVEKYLKFGNFE